MLFPGASLAFLNHCIYRGWPDSGGVHRRPRPGGHTVAAVSCDGRAQRRRRSLQGGRNGRSMSARSPGPDLRSCARAGRPAFRWREAGRMSFAMRPELPLRGSPDRLKASRKWANLLNRGGAQRSTLCVPSAHEGWLSGGRRSSPGHRACSVTRG